MVDATVKMFDPERGFGFVAPADGSRDAFLHIGVLQAAGHDAPNAGTKLRVQVGEGPKGPQVTAVLEVDRGDAGAARPGSVPRPPVRDAAPLDAGDATEVDGTVKWFSPEKGFGFVTADDGGKDVFLHITVLQKSGLQGVAEGTPVSMRVRSTQKGREAVSVAVLA